MAAVPGQQLTAADCRRRLASQLLLGEPARSPEAVAQRLLAVQAQDPRGARLAVRARTTGLTVRDFDAALAAGSLLISWLCRGTLHLVTAEDFFWLHDLTVPQLAAGSRRRLAQERVSPDQAARGAGLIAGWLAEDGPLLRSELGERLQAHGIPTAGQALVHILFHATLEGLIVRGPMRGGQQAFVLTEDWLGPRPAPRDRQEALVEAVRRYLAGHAPARDGDIARWFGLTLRDVRAGLERLAPELADRRDGLLELSRSAAGGPPAGRPRPRLLGAFDAMLVGWRDRSFITTAHEPQVVTGGIFRAFMMVNGRACGLWRIERETIRMEPFAPLRRPELSALETDAADVRRYLRLGGSERA